MRTKNEVRDIISAIEKINNFLRQKIEARSNGDYGLYPDDDSIAAFNENAKLLAALHWVLGENSLVLVGLPATKTDFS